MKASFRVLGILMAMSLCAVACSDDKKADGETCTKAEECQSNFCSAEGQCAVQPENGGSTEDGGSTENGGSTPTCDPAECAKEDQICNPNTNLCEDSLCAKCPSGHCNAQGKCELLFANDSETPYAECKDDTHCRSGEKCIMNACIHELQLNAEAGADLDSLSDSLDEAAKESFRVRYQVCIDENTLQKSSNDDGVVELKTCSEGCINLFNYDADIYSSEFGFDWYSECKENLKLNYEKCPSSLKGASLMGMSYYTECSEDASTVTLGYCYSDVAGKHHMLKLEIPPTKCQDNSCKKQEEESNELGYDYYWCEATAEE